MIVVTFHIGIVHAKRTLRRTSKDGELGGLDTVIRRRVIEDDVAVTREQKNGGQLSGNSRGIRFSSVCLQTHRCNETADIYAPIDEISNQWNRSTRSSVYILFYGLVLLPPLAGNNLRVDNCFVVYQMVSNTSAEYIDLNRKDVIKWIRTRVRTNGH